MSLPLANRPNFDASVVANIVEKSCQNITLTVSRLNTVLRFASYINRKLAVNSPWSRISVTAG